MKKNIITSIVCTLLITASPAFTLTDPEIQEIKKIIQEYKNDPRGPFQAIRWFCPDGSILPPDQRCPEPGGIQHGLIKGSAVKLAKEHAIFLGQILAGSPISEFFDAANQNSRVKQYQLESYLQSIDNGWIFRKARFYRGAVQAEDEENWGYQFLTWLFSQNNLIESQFFFLHSLAKDIPHGIQDQRIKQIRSLAQSIANQCPAFQDIRIKIHGQPDSSDLQRVSIFRKNFEDTLSPGLLGMVSSLEEQLEEIYHTSENELLKSFESRFPSSQQSGKLFDQFIWDMNQTLGEYPYDKCKLITDYLWNIRILVQKSSSPKERIALMDLSNTLEELLFNKMIFWNPETLGDFLIKTHLLCKASAGCGYIEMWEWNNVEGVFNLPLEQDQIPLTVFQEQTETSKRVLEWSTGMIFSTYRSVADLFGDFEPLSHGYMDNFIRASILLPLGETVGRLYDIKAILTKSKNNILNIRSQNEARGLNPGLAFGELEVLTKINESVKFSSDKIYILYETPPDLKPVAGIATVSEGNLVSHIQLLARNLAVPNAIMSQKNFNELMPFKGEKVFYAVSPKGRIVMKSAGERSGEEIAMTEEKEQSADRIKVPVQKLDLKQTDLLSLNMVRSKDSGKFCGPKAANLGQLKSLFPKHVMDGLVIPFGVFKKHLDQTIPGDSQTYWDALRAIFSQAETDRKAGKPEEEIQAVVFNRLTQFRELLRQMPLKSDFLKQLDRRFIEIFRVPMGELPVFIRSDTNMEDLKDFTGAGLNLTVFNVVEKEKILQAIRDVWISPFTERSYRWRQKLLLNPENVYPSILIMPAVDVEKSGVMITANLLNGNEDDVTVAFNWGAGGAVQGQASESYILYPDQQPLLLSPSRETTYIRLPRTGGTQTIITYFQQPILSSEDCIQLQSFAHTIRQTFSSSSDMSMEGPWDVELGFKDGQIWLFQVRPYVENKKAKSSYYLQKLDPPDSRNFMIPLTKKIKSF